LGLELSCAETKNYKLRLFLSNCSLGAIAQKEQSFYSGAYGPRISCALKDINKEILIHKNKKQEMP
jgi:hypothetical protein